MTFLNVDQANFYNYVINNQDSNGIILLNAPAGTGKSYTIKQVIKKLYRYHVLAPTNKACSILSNDIRGVMTIHKFLNSRHNVDDNGFISFKFNENLNYRNNVIIVDECSMINNDMFNIFLKLSEKNMIIFVGDDLQLPPINNDCDDSKKYNISTKSMCFTCENERTFNFTKNMRSRLLASTLMLENARKSCYSETMPTKLNSLPIDNIISIFKENLETDKSVVILSYTNASVNNYNNIIRSSIFNESIENLQKYYIGEKLIFSGCCVKNDIKYVTSDEIIIKDLDIIELKIDFVRCDCKDNEYKRTKCKKHDFRKDFIILKFYRIVDQNKSEWLKPVNDKQFYILQSQYKKLCTIKKQSSIWKKYYEFIDEFNADLKYNYAMTVHKSQGSQFNIVFVDRSNIISCCSQDLLLKINCYYTAISRMIEEVYDIEK